MSLAPLQDIADRLDRIAPRLRANLHPISGFKVSFNDTTKGATVSFVLARKLGIATIVLKRNFTIDEGSSVIVNTWDVAQLKNGSSLSFNDTDQTIRNNPSVYYWLECQPFLDDSGPVVVGPETLAINSDQAIPDAIPFFDVSHEAVSGGTVRIGISFVPPSTRFGSCKIQISGYSGVLAFVDIAQEARSPFSFALKQTGETVSIKAIAVSQNGIQAASGPVKVLTLGVAATVPAQIFGATAIEISTGVQLSFPAGGESTITQYQIYRGSRGLGFAGASSIGTVTPTGASGYTFLDTGGLGGTYEWYVFAVNAVGNGAPSTLILPSSASLTSADQPPAAPSNTTNQASVTSSDAGSDTTIDVSGFSGVGTSWVRPTGFGNQTLPHFTILHKAYSTKYWVVWDTINQVGLAFTTALQALGDNFAFAGVVTTVAPGGGGGVPGGGGSSGGTGGGIRLPL